MNQNTANVWGWVDNFNSNINSIDVFNTIIAMLLLNNYIFMISFSVMNNPVLSS